MRRLLFFLLLLSLTGVGANLFANGQGEAKQAVSATPQVLRVTAPPWAFKKFPLEAVAKMFEKSNPGVIVKLTRDAQWNVSTYIAAWRSGSTPVDVYVGGTGSMLAPVIAGNWTTPLDDLLTGSLAKKNFVGGYLAAGRYRKPDGSGAYYPVLPFMGECAIIGVNVPLMKKAGLWKDGTPVPIPSWNEQALIGWFEKLKAVAANGAIDEEWSRQYMQYDFLAPLQAMQGSFLAPNRKGFDVTSPDAHKLFTIYQAMYKDGVGIWTTENGAHVNNWKTTQLGALFAAQSQAMELANVTGKPSDVAYVGWPGMRKNGSVIWTNAVWISKLSKVQALDKKFVADEIFSKYFSQWGFNHYGKLPVLKAYYGRGITRFQSAMPEILKIADRSQPIPVYADMEQYLDILQEYLPAIAFDRISVSDGLAKIEAASKNLDFTNLRAN